ncbi:MAG TPA: ATP-binding protein [Thermodesulfovibrio thiophilus]|uniref:sensor histidine kinase n=1 Tax=Thermodesulfovibrio thiophilus TaxID=340095 RepID=UPI0017E36174|nr:ATP-binding protein [Thermodesulfovibrio thiophilus]HHW19869.1 PAS domain-containing protein [Thermodesulfovibrio thiophilus]HOA82533.1 ATP-binding protein [Thermodesulfovibrio thiophilus]HQA03163.1 ATP-binding protein [Thermodesulfovibrio thiophilus]
MELFIFVIVLLILIIFILTGKIRTLSSKLENLKQEEQLYDFSTVKSSQSFETILKSITEGLLIIDPKGYIMLANQSVKDILKIDESPEGKQVIEIVRNIDLINLISLSMSKKEDLTAEITVKKGGKDIYLLAKAMPVVNSEDKILFLIILLHDITRLKQLENVRRDFVANVSHELKTPVTAIKGYAETLLDGAIDDRENSKKFIEIIKNQADRLTALVEDLLTLSRIEFGDIKIEKKEILLDEIVNSVFQILGDKADKKDIHLQKDIPPRTIIQADKHRLMQIMINLVDNGIKFTEKGFVKVVFFKKNSKGIISVEDTGIGISKEHLQRIGERFYRVDQARSRQLGGTGLGLAIVKHLVLAHGWQLDMKSEVGEGTTIQIVIPEQDIIQF